MSATKTTLNMKTIFHLSNWTTTTTTTQDTTNSSASHTTSFSWSPAVANIGGSLLISNGQRLVQTHPLIHRPVWQLRQDKLRGKKVNDTLALWGFLGGGPHLDSLTGIDEVSHILVFSREEVRYSEGAMVEGLILLLKSPKK